MKSLSVQIMTEPVANAPLQRTVYSSRPQSVGASGRKALTLSHDIAQQIRDRQRLRICCKGRKVKKET